MTLQDRIVAADAELVSLKDALVEATKALEAAPEEETLLIEVEELSAKVEKHANTAQALKNAEKALAERAQRAVAAPAQVQAKHMKTAPEGLLFKHATAKFIAFAERKHVNEVIAERYPDQMDVVKESFDHIQKTAVSPADTTTAGWAAELVQNDVRGFLDTLRTTSVAAALASKSQTLNFGGYNSITVPRRNPLSAAPTEPAWVGEGGVIPLTQFSFGSAVINRYKLAAITTMTKEIVERSTPAIEGIMRNALSEAYSVVLDNAMLSNAAAVAGVRPAGLRNGITTAAGNATGGSTSLIADLKGMLSYMQTNRTGSRPVLLMNNQTRLSVAMLQSSLSEFLYRDEISQGRLLGMEVVSSDHVPTGVVIMVDADALVTAFDAPTFDVSDVATVTEANADRTAPTQVNTATADAIGAAGTEGTVLPDLGQHVTADGVTRVAGAGVVARSLWQTYSVGIRMVAPTSWAMLRPNSLVERTAVTW